MKRKIRHADLTELNGEPLGEPGPPVTPAFVPSPARVRQLLKTAAVTLGLEAGSLAYYRREARRRGETPAALMRRVLHAHALADA